MQVTDSCPDIQRLSGHRTPKVMDHHFVPTLLICREIGPINQSDDSPVAKSILLESVQTNAFEPCIVSCWNQCRHMRMYVFGLISFLSDCVCRLLYSLQTIQLTSSENTHALQDHAEFYVSTTSSLLVETSFKSFKRAHNFNIEISLTFVLHLYSGSSLVKYSPSRKRLHLLGHFVYKTLHCTIMSSAFSRGQFFCPPRSSVQSMCRIGIKRVKI